MQMKAPIRQVLSSERLFFLSYGIMMFFGILSTSFYYKYFAGTPYKAIIVFFTALPAVRELVIRHNIKKDLVSGLICFLAFALTVRMRTSVAQLAAAATFAFIFYARNISFEKIAKFTIGITSITVAFVIISSFIGLIDHYIMIDTAGGMKTYRVTLKNMGEVMGLVQGASRIRAYLGFRYALYAPNFVSNIIMLVIYCRKNTIKWKELLILFLVNLGMFVFTDARLSFCLTTVFLFLAAVLKVFPDFLEKRNILCYLMTASFCICFVLSIQMAVHYDPSVEWQRTLNSLLGRRLEFSNRSLCKYGVSWFGEEITWVGFGLDMYGQQNPDSYLYVDNLYMQIIQHYGSVFTGLILILFTAALSKCHEKKNYYLMLCLVLVAGHGVIDDLILHLHYNTFWLAIGTSLFRTSCGEEG